MEQNKIWEYYQNEGASNFDGSYKRLEYLVSLFEKGDRVLNIGVGGGNFETIAVAANIEVYSVDPDKKAIERIGAKLGENRAKTGYIDNLPFKENTFDGVVVSEVFEHLSDEIIKNGIKEITRVLKKDGRLVGTTPYKEELLEQLCVCPKCGERFHRWGHIQSFDEARMGGFLKKSLAVSSLRPKFFIAWRFLNFKGKLAALLQIVLFRLGLLSSKNQNLFFEAVKK